MASPPVVGDVYAGQPRLLQAPSPPEQISVPGDDVLNWADNVRDAVGAVTREALAHPGDPAYWKPGPAGWLVQGSHDGQPLVVMVDADGVVTDAWHGGFSQSTQTSVPEAVSALHTALDEAKVVDADNGVVALRLPSGSTIEVRLAVDPDLAREPPSWHHHVMS